MQTFVTATPDGSLEQPELHLIAVETARTLDRARLGKQRLEAKQIWTALETGEGWIHHPATHMWRGHQDSLAMYGYLMCLEFQRRGYEDSLGDWFAQRFGDNPQAWPWWFGNKEMVATHRSKLIGKWPEKYLPQFKSDPLATGFALPYLWPLTPSPGKFTVSLAEYRRTGQWSVPSHWRVDAVTHEVTFGNEKRWNRAMDDGVFYE